MKITRPTLLLDEKRCRENIRFMTAKARRHQLKFRPHFKTHQSYEIAEWFREEGVSAITVSSVQMAEYFAARGWKEILIAFPCNVLEYKKINQLAKAVKLQLLLGDVEAFQTLEDKLEQQVEAFVEIDTGANRTGIPSGDLDQIEELVEAILGSSNIRFVGFYSHAGNTYKAMGKEHVEDIHGHTRSEMAKIRQFFSSDVPEISICIGDTPSCSLCEDFRGIDAMSPGNFVFYDLMQATIGACNLQNIAVALACPVVAKNKERQEVTIHGGAVHFSKDFLTGDDNQPYFGKVVRLLENGWSVPLEECFVKSLSQEHGILSVSNDFFDTINIGDVIGVLPVHSCLTADTISGYQTLDGQILTHQKSRII